MNFTEKDIERFMRYFEKLPSGCWFWNGARSRGKGNRKWYGSFRVGKKAVRAHRFACEAIGGKYIANGGKYIAIGEHRDHTCGFSLCVNPAHLECVPASVNNVRKIQRKKAQQHGQDIQPH